MKSRKIFRNDKNRNIKIIEQSEGADMRGKDIRSEASRKFDLICLGRLGVDLNCNQHNCPMSEVESFSPTVGGSPANIAIGAAKLGASVGFLGRISDDQFGDFILKKLAEYGVDADQVVRDKSGAKNGLAVTEILTPTKSGSVLYRDQVADLNLTYEDISEEYIAQSKILLVSGTALARSPSREAAFLAAHYAHKHKVKLAIDIDHRAYTWTCPKESALYYQMFCCQADIIIGNSSEFDVMCLYYMPDRESDETLAKSLLQDGASLVMMKYGEKGSVAYEADGTVTKCGIFPADLKKTFGSGDAFAAGLLTGIAQGKSLQESMTDGSAAASIVVSSYSCSAASPTRKELDEYIRTHPMTAFGGRA